jgi:hypothetical protein
MVTPGRGPRPLDVPRTHACPLQACLCTAVRSRRACQPSPANHRPPAPCRPAVGLCLAVLMPRKLAVLRFEAAPGQAFLQARPRGHGRGPREPRCGRPNPLAACARFTHDACGRRPATPPLFHRSRACSSTPWSTRPPTWRSGSSAAAAAQARGDAGARAPGARQRPATGTAPCATATARPVLNFGSRLWLSTLAGLDAVCVQSYDGQLVFFEGGAGGFSRLLPNFLVPGPLCYWRARRGDLGHARACGRARPGRALPSGARLAGAQAVRPPIDQASLPPRPVPAPPASRSPSTDSLITCSAALELESYRYGALAAAAPGGREQTGGRAARRSAG